MRPTALLFFAGLTAGSAPAFAQQRLERLFEAARSLEWTQGSKPGNTAYILEKQETVPAAVGLIFGYADNRSACEAIAATLTTSRREGTFKCYPVN
jgi:hypothetical protein